MPSNHPPNADPHRRYWAPFTEAQWHAAQRVFVRESGSPRAITDADLTLVAALLGEMGLSVARANGEGLEDL